MKKIEISLENGDLWQVPLMVIAEHRANYYINKSDDSIDYSTEIEFIMNDEYEGIDWLKNNMELSDFGENLTIIPGIREVIDWQNSEMCITNFLVVNDRK